MALGEDPTLPSHIPRGLWGQRAQVLGHLHPQSTFLRVRGSRRPKPRALHLQAPSRAYALHPHPTPGMCFEAEDLQVPATARLHSLPPQPRGDVAGEGGCLLQRLPQLSASLLPPQRLQSREGQGKPRGGAISHQVDSRPMSSAAGKGSIRSSAAVLLVPAAVYCLLSR